MYDADAIEAINFEQLATVTDRLLLRGGRVSKRRPSIPSLVQHVRGSQSGIAPGAQPSIARPAVVSRVQPAIEHTVAVRAARNPRSGVFATTVVIPTLVGIAVGLAAML